MQEKIIITSDSTTDLGPELIEKYNILILPLGVTMGDRLYTDGVDISPKDIYANYEKNKSLPKTSAINTADALKFFRRLVEDGSKVIHFTISSDMSSTFQNCSIAAQEFEGVYVVDTRNLSSGGGQLVLLAAELAEQGVSAEEIVRKCQDTAESVDASFVIDNLEFLAKGGRCSTVAAIGANLLKLKPCITVKNGTMGVGKKYRGDYERVLHTYIDERLGDCRDILPEHVFITHAGVDEKIVQACVDQVKAKHYFKEIHVTVASCTISSHCGKNTLGILFTRNHAI